MANLSQRLTNSMPHYSQELNCDSNLECMSDINSEDRKTQVAVQENPSTHRISMLSRRNIFPYEPSTIIDDRLHELALKYEIKQQYAEYLRKLEEYEIIILCDDSGSMRTTVDGTSRTRWDELCYIVKIVLEIGVIFDQSGVDLFFLNRKSFTNVKDAKVVYQIFSNEPRGYTPLVTALKTIFQLPTTRRGHDKKALVFIATDGAPTDEDGNINVEELEHLMNKERTIETTHVMFLICTDDPTCVDYLNEWRNSMVNVDVTDDYRTERNRFQKKHGPTATFSVGDYIVKALVGSIHPKIKDI